MLLRLRGGRATGSARRAPFQERSAGTRWRTPAKASPRRQVRVVEVVRETPSTSTFRLAVEDGRPFPYRPGQYLTVVVEVDGVRLRRAYSFSSFPGADELPAITVKRVPGGIVSNHLNDRVRVGDLLEVLGPNGGFTLDAVDSRSAPGGDLVFVAGGSGITPVMSLTQAALASDSTRRVLLLYGNRCVSEIIFRDRLAALEAADARLEVRHWLEEADAADRSRGVCCGRLTGEAAVDAVADCTGREFYVCGPEPMMDSVEAALARAGVARDRIRLERFTFAARPAAGRPSEGFAIRYAKSDTMVEAEAGQTVLEAGLAAGVPLAFSCTMGGCGACKVRVSTGSVVMDEPNCLSAEEAAAGQVLACVAYAREPLTVEA